MSDEESSSKAADDDDANAILNDLLLRLDEIIDDARRTTAALPRVMVEATLRGKTSGRISGHRLHGRGHQFLGGGILQLKY